MGLVPIVRCTAGIGKGTMKDVEVYFMESGSEQKTAVFLH